MKTNNLWWAVGFGGVMLLSAGCGKSKALTAAEDYQKAACECKDAKCVTDAAQKFAAHAQDMATASSGEAEAITKATTAAAQCSTKVAMAGIPGAPGAKR
jgi:hypothetical protein